MLIAIDIGNTNTTFGLYDRKELTLEWTLKSVRDRTSDELGDLLRQFFDSAAVDVNDVSGIIISSVVPELDLVFGKLSESVFGFPARFVDHTYDFGFRIKYDPPLSVGTDRLVDAFATVQKYGAPCIVCDFGTATTIDAVTSGMEYIGGIIAPGIQTMADSLFEKTSKLPKVRIIKPGKVIGASTEGSIQSGIYFGYIGLVDGIIARMISEMLEKPVIVSTGGAAEFIAEGSEFVQIVDKTLLLDGLRMLHARN